MQNCVKNDVTQSDKSNQIEQVQFESDGSANNFIQCFTISAKQMMLRKFTTQCWKRCNFIQFNTIKAMQKCGWNALHFFFQLEPTQHETWSVNLTLVVLIEGRIFATQHQPFNRGRNAFQINALSANPATLQKVECICIAHDTILLN